MSLPCSLDIGGGTACSSPSRDGGRKSVEDACNLGGAYEEGTLLDGTSAGAGGAGACQEFVMWRPAFNCQRDTVGELAKKLLCLT